MSNTKAVAARIPLDEFYKLQKEAVELKMSMNDYLIYLIHRAREVGIDAAENVSNTGDNSKLKNEIIGDLQSTKIDTKSFIREISGQQSSLSHEDVLNKLVKRIEELTNKYKAR
jgi:hypothetical protein